MATATEEEGMVVVEMAMVEVGLDLEAEVMAVEGVDLVATEGAATACTHKRGGGTHR